MNENYRALTRAYRPQTFEDIVSQEHVSNTLKNAIKGNRLSHAYLFSGPRGVGKTTMARVLARVVNEVDRGVDGESLGRTLNIVEMDAASNRKIEDVRSLKEVIRVPPQNGKYKIFIIDEVHMLTKEAFNALLKTLEEPPAHAIFIFATTEPHKVLPTILSRVQRFDFKRIAVNEIVERLKMICQKESIRIDEESLHVIAKRADGALRDALGLMDQAIAFCGASIEYKELLRALNVVDKDHLFSFMEAVKERDSHTGLTLIRELIQAGTDIQEFLVTLTEHIRNLYVASSSDRLHLIEASGETKNRYKEQAGSFSEDDLMRMLHLVSEAQYKMKEAQQPRVHFEILMLKLIHMSRARELNTLLEEMQALKKNSGNRERAADVMAGGEQNSGLQEEQAAPDTSSQLSQGTAPPAVPDPDAESQLDPGVQESDLYGKPSLGSAAAPEGKAGSSSSGNIAPVEKTAGKKINGIEDVTEKWDEFLENLKEAAPRMLYFQMQRVEVCSLKGRHLTVMVDNEFARQLVEENQLLLAKLLNQQYGASLKISCRVQRSSQNQDTDSLSPYEQFMELQKKDPHIRTLVEIFGAELEY